MQQTVAATADKLVHTSRQESEEVSPFECVVSLLICQPMTASSLALTHGHTMFHMSVMKEHQLQLQSSGHGQ